MAVFDNLNATYSGGVAPSVTEYFERKLLDHVRNNHVYGMDTQKRALPAHNGRTVQFRKWTPFAPIDTPLQEGVTPDGQTLSMTELRATIKPYGRHVELTDEMDWALLDVVILLEVVFPSALMVISVTETVSRSMEWDSMPLVEVTRAR